MGFFDAIEGTVRHAAGGVTAATLGTAGALGATLKSPFDGGKELKQIDLIYANAFDLGAKGGFETKQRRRTLADFPSYALEHHREQPVVGTFTGAIEDLYRGTASIVRSTGGAGRDLGEGASDLIEGAGKITRDVGRASNVLADVNRSLGGLLVPAALVVGGFFVVRELTD